MDNNRRRVVRTISAVGMLGCLPMRYACASDYPGRPIKIIVPYPPGGGTDMVPRAVAEYLTQDLKEPVVVQNRPGADGAIGTGIVGRAPPDGYTLLAGASGPLVTNPFFQKFDFDPATSLTAVAMLAYSPFVLIVPLSSPYRSVKQIVDTAKQHPDLITFASSGIGSSGHLAGVLFQKTTGVTMLHVPYSGASSAMVDVMAGRVDCFFAAFPSASSAIKGKQVRAIAMATATRSPLMPDLPTVAEAGYPDFRIGTWVSIMAPATTAREIVDVLYRSIQKAIETPKIKAFFARVGCEPYFMNPDQLTAYVSSERVRWGKLLKGAGLGTA